MNIKSINDQILGTKENISHLLGILLHNLNLASSTSIESLLGSHPLQTYTKFIDSLSRGALFTNLLDIWPKLGLAQLDLSHSAFSTHLFCNNTRMFNKLTNSNTWINMLSKHSQLEDLVVFLFTSKSGEGLMQVFLKGWRGWGLVQVWGFIHQLSKTFLHQYHAPQDFTCPSVCPTHKSAPEKPSAADQPVIIFRSSIVLAHKNYNLFYDSRIELVHLPWIRLIAKHPLPDYKVGLSHSVLCAFLSESCGQSISWQC